VQRPVKRTYDNDGRQARSGEARARILAAARDQMMLAGYRATTVAQIARTAGVHVDTVYQLAGRKPAILRELLEQAISGTDHPVAPAQRPYVQEMEAEPDPARKLAIYARATAEVQTRMAPLLLALRDAATTEPEAREVWQEISDRRARNMRLLVSALGPPGTLRDGVGVEQAADIVWATGGAEMFIMLTVERGWDPSSYEAWLGDAWCRLLLAEPKKAKRR
jgi:AcrR family transcriptional regulator